MYEVLYDMNVLYDAFKKSKQGVDWKGSVQKFEHDIFSELIKIRNSLLDETYKQGAFFEFDICERGKQRHIRSLLIRDRIVQRALCDYVLEPVLYPLLIYDNGASVKNKGIDFAKRRLVTHLQKYYRKHGNEGYILLIDFYKFFDSIPHDKVLKSVKPYFNDEKIMSLLTHLVNSFAIDNNYRSLGIGSQISQILGIYYPTRIDNYCKIVKQCKFYGRYMDDIYIIHSDKKFLHSLLRDIVEIAEDMGLEINMKKTQIRKINKGFTYLKTFIFITDTGKIIRKPCRQNLVRERRKIKKLKKKMDIGKVTFEDILNSYKSWRGNIKKYNCYKVLLSTDKLFYTLFNDEIKVRKIKNILE